MSALVIISTTVEEKKDGEKMARLLLNEKLVACAQLSSPATSYYRWHGNRVESVEFRLTLKTTTSLCEQVKARLKETHPYELPEVIVQTVKESSAEYLKWVESEVRR